MKELSFVFLLVAGLAASGHAQDDAFRAKNFNLKDGVALSGYDPVSYFEGKPEEGSSDIKTAYKGVTYYFASQAHLERFRQHPDMYEPAYGGWCAYAMGDSGDKVKIDPETYKIINGRLYLFYNFWGNNTLSSWNKDEQHLKTSADANWNKLGK